GSRGHQLHREPRPSMAVRAVSVTARDGALVHPGGRRPASVRQAALPEGGEVRLRHRDRQRMGDPYHFQRCRARRPRRAVRTRPARAENRQDSTRAGRRSRPPGQAPQASRKRHL
ncbi:MAG: hypothetical protein AVDCRST_MAG19-1400, partial [uncultured Thermomicrobiales bacterium]